MSSLYNILMSYFTFSLSHCISEVRHVFYTYSTSPLSHLDT